MTRLLASVLLAAGCFSAHAQSLQITPCEAGEHYRYTQADCKIELYNPGKTPIHLTGIKGFREGDKAAVSAIVVKPEAKAYLPVTINLDTSAGFVAHYFAGSSDETNSPQYQMIARAFVYTVLDDVRPILNFGTVDAEKGAPAKSITLSSGDVPDFRIEKVLSAPDFLDVSIDNGRTLSVRPKPGIAWGLHEDIIRLRINAPEQTEERVRVRMDVHGAVVPDSNPVNVGLMRQGKQNETLIRLTSKNGEDFKIGDIQTKRVDAKVSVQPCVHDEKGCKLLKVEFNPGQPVGEIIGQVLVDLPEYHSTLPISLWGMLVKPETQVRAIGDESKGPSDSVFSDSVSRSISAAAPISDAIKKAVVAPEALQAPPGRGPLLKWTVANERGIYGYLIYRSESETGGSIRANREIVRAAGKEDEPSTYQYRDNTAVSGKVYWYYISILYNDGHKQQLTGPQKVTAK